MQTASGLPVRQSARMRGHAYRGEAVYFVTICAREMRCLFGRCVEERMEVNELGAIVEEQWLRTGELRADVDLDLHVVMPNHFHALLFLPREQDLRKVVNGFKAAVTSEVRRMLRDPEFVVWKRSFHDRIVRNERELERIRAYIANNPAAWAMDRYYR